MIEGLSEEDFDDDELKICGECAGRWTHGLQSSIEGWDRTHVAKIPDYQLEGARALATELDWQSTRSDNGVNASLVDKYLKLVEEISPGKEDEEDDLEDMAD